MKNIKRLGLTTVLLLAFSSFTLAQESEIVMTQQELDSFLSKVAEARRQKLESEKSVKVRRISSPKMIKSVEGRYEDENRVMRQLDRINNRIDNLFMLHAMNGKMSGDNSTLVVPGSSRETKLVDSRDALIADLQRQLDELKNSDKNVVLPTTTDLKQNLSPEEERVVNAKTPEERRDALKDLLAKFKNFKKQVFFANDSDKVTSADMNYINDVVTLLNRYPELSIVLEGWASPRGNANYNKQLSMRRSESVEKALLNKGISADRVVSSFKGEDHSTSEAMARRVDMSVILK